MATIREYAPGEWCFDNELDDEAIRERFFEAVEQGESGEYDEAMEGFRSILAAHPQHIDCIQSLSVIHEFLGNRPEARALAHYAAQTGLNALPADFSWGTARLSWGHLENRPFMRAYHNHALWLERDGDYRAAEEVYVRLVAVHPNDNLGARCLLMRSFLRRSDWSAAAKLGAQYPDDTSADMLYSPALALYELGQVDDATSALKSAIECNSRIARELLGTTHKEPPNSIIPGSITSDGEAYNYWRDNGEYWKRNGDLLLLLDRLVNRKT